MLRAATALTHPTPPAGPATSYRLLMAPLALFVFTTAALQTAVIPAIPTMQRELHVSTSSIAWVLTLTTLVSCVALPILGRIGDMFGKRRVILVMCGVTALGCLLPAVSASLPALLVGRALQGFAVGAFSICFSIVRDELPAERRARAFGLLSAMWGVAGAAGFSLSGVAVDRLSYRSIFWIAFTLVLVAAGAIALFVAESPVRSPARIDWVGALLFAPGLASVLLALGEGSRWGWSSPAVVLLAVGGSATLAAFVFWELRVSEPLTDLRLLATRSVRAVDSTAVLGSVALFTIFFVTPKVVQAPPASGYGLGASATDASLYLLPMAITQLVGSLHAPRLAERFGSRTAVMAGMAAMVGAFLVFEAAFAHGWAVLAASFLAGLGLGVANTASVHVLSLSVPQTQIGEANAVTTMLRNVGASFGATIAGAVLGATLAAGGAYPSANGYRIVLAIGGAAALLAVWGGAHVRSQGYEPVLASAAS